MGAIPYPNPQIIFQQQYEAVRRDEVVGVLLALFLGCFGVHHFYLGRTGLGVLYLCFCWTGIPAILGLVECFFMPGRVRQYNAMQALYISSQVLGSTGSTGPAAPPASTRCDTCGNIVDPTAVFCNHCGAAVSRTALTSQPAL